jgi:hypothetical protein
MIRRIFSLFFVLSALCANAQDWTLKDIGVGLVFQDENYSTVLNVAQEKESWNMDELYAQGAFAGKYKGNQTLAAWIQGPPTTAFQNANGIPVWLYKYKITYPDGSIYEPGPYGFYAPGFAVVSLDYGKKGPHKCKIEFSIWNRETDKTRFVGAVEFIAIYSD